jgi:hypothetical protein
MTFDLDRLRELRGLDLTPRWRTEFRHQARKHFESAAFAE